MVYDLISPMTTSKSSSLNLKMLFKHNWKKHVLSPTLKIHATPYILLCSYIVCKVINGALRRQNLKPMESQQICSPRHD
ncbi:unnamed protein product [Heterobilharzia americana]|nr:unnamed protein product [Heterobilharzia americana]